MELKIQNLDKLLTLQGCSMDRFFIDDDGDSYDISFYHTDYEGFFILRIHKKITNGYVSAELTWEKSPHNYPYGVVSFSLTDINTLTKFCDKIDALCHTNIYNI